jgi:uncharacterized membrane protein
MDADAPAPVIGSERRVFEAVLYPNRPLGRAGFILLMLGVSSVSVVLGVAFAVVGAWPVAGFLGLDVVLLYLAFRAAQRRGQRREHIRLDDSGLRVRRIEADGAATDWRFEPYWVRVELEDPPQRHSLLILASHELKLHIGVFLTLEERLELARALRSALHHYR